MYSILRGMAFSTFVLASTACFAGAGVDFTVSNRTGKDIVIEFVTDQSGVNNCLEPSVLSGFIPSKITIKAGERWMKTINRRNGHGCNGRNALFQGRPIMGNKVYGWTGFFLTGDGGMDRTYRTHDYTSQFQQLNLKGRNTYIWTVFDPTPTVEPPDAEKLALLQRYAPRIHLAQGEEFGPSSVEWAFKQMNRVQRNGNWWLYAKQNLSSPSDSSLALFKGDPQNAPVYAFWVSGKAGGVTDLVYFTFYPYNRGKKLVDTVWGNHVGDWENMVVRLDRNYQPKSVFLSQHDGDGVHAWRDLGKTDTHPVVYSARGSHGLYPTAKANVYKPEFGLTDYTSKGMAWDTWTRLEAFDFGKKRNLRGGVWPRWMDTDYAINPRSPKNGNADPASGAIFRWGNGENGCGGALKLYKSATGECRLNDGPTGPVDKGDRWERDAFLNKSKSPLGRHFRY